MAVPTIDALESLLKRIEGFQRQCSEGSLRTEEMNALLSDLDRRTELVLRAEDDDLFRLFDRRRREHTDFLKVTVSRYVDPSDCANLDYRAETLRQVIDKYSPGFLDPGARAKVQHFFGAGEGYRAMRLVLQILKGARTSVAIVDEYLDDQVFDYIDSIDPAVSVRMVTGSKKPMFPKLLHALQANRANVEAREAGDCHDRFLIVDATAAWHVGTSLNGIGKKAFMINMVADPTELQRLIASFTSWWGKGTPI